MLLIFKGKGCSQCPFRYWQQVSYGDEYFCSLSKARLAGEIQLQDLDPNSLEKPKDCPFAQFPNTLEIEAHNE